MDMSIETRCHRKHRRDRTAAHAFRKLRASPRNVGRERDRARPNLRVCGSAAILIRAYSISSHDRLKRVAQVIMPTML